MKEKKEKPSYIPDELCKKCGASTKVLWENDGMGYNAHLERRCVRCNYHEYIKPIDAL